MRVGVVGAEVLVGVAVAPIEVGVAVGGTWVGVCVGGTPVGVLVAGCPVGVFVGGIPVGVLVGGTGVFVGVLVGGTGVGVLVGGDPWRVSVMVSLMPNTEAVSVPLEQSALTLPVTGMGELPRATIFIVPLTEPSARMVPCNVPKEGIGLVMFRLPVRAPVLVFVCNCAVPPTGIGDAAMV